MAGRAPPSGRPLARVRPHPTRTPPAHRKISIFSFGPAHRQLFLHRCLGRPRTAKDHRAGAQERAEALHRRDKRGEAERKVSGSKSVHLWFFSSSRRGSSWDRARVCAAADRNSPSPHQHAWQPARHFHRTSSTHRTGTFVRSRADPTPSPRSKCRPRVPEPLRKSLRRSAPHVRDP